jgi:hypothetical protein
MKSILMFLALGFTLFAAPTAVTYPQQDSSQQGVRLTPSEIGSRVLRP